MTCVRIVKTVKLPKKTDLSQFLGSALTFDDVVLDDYVCIKAELKARFDDHDLVALTYEPK